MRRVGCFPCIMSNKKELRSILKHRPERVDYLKEKEALVQNAVGDSSNGIMRTFFHANTIPLKVRTGPEILDSKGRPSRITTIDDVFRWSLTKWGGTEIDTDVDYDEPVSCASSSGMCE